MISVAVRYVSLIQQVERAIFEYILVSVDDVREFNTTFHCLLDSGQHSVITLVWNLTSKYNPPLTQGDSPGQ